MEFRRIAEEIQKDSNLLRAGSVFIQNQDTPVRNMAVVRVATEGRFFSLIVRGNFSATAIFAKATFATAIFAKATFVTTTLIRIIWDQFRHSSPLQLWCLPFDC
jgi:hypothetical protein